MTPEALVREFRHVAPAVDYCSIRLVEEHHETIRVRQNILQPLSFSEERGVMVTVGDGGGEGYAATSDVSREGLRRALDEARGWARSAIGNAVARPAGPGAPAYYRSPVGWPWSEMSLADKIALVHEQCARLKTDDRIVDWEAMLWYSSARTLFLTADGEPVEQEFEYLVPYLHACASDDSETQTRSLGGLGCCRQGGFETLDDAGFLVQAPHIAEQALELLSAPDCPSGEMDLVLAPDQMILQIHESIGHPLELDRILGDERNYAGTSFVTPDMFGQYQYGSSLLNVSFDPTVDGQYATYSHDDEGTPAKRQFLIRDGLLVRGLGGATSQARAHLPGVANARACSWNRPAIDRMANLNLEPGETTFEDLIGGIESGVFMQTNSSWSIDDSRNKFQFGCERGQLIKDGELAGVVKKPNYRGISANFWRNLNGVGTPATRELLGTPYCGKGEPNQCVRVGHASPVCRFGNVSVFGGD